MQRKERTKERKCCYVLEKDLNNLTLDLTGFIKPFTQSLAEAKEGGMLPFPLYNRSTFVQPQI